MPDRRNFTARLRKSMGYSSRLKKASRKRPMDGLETYRQDALDDSMHSIEQGQAEARKKEAAPKKEPQGTDYTEWLRQTRGDGLRAESKEPPEELEDLPW